MKHVSVFVFISLSLPSALYAQPPGYYNGAAGKNGEALRVALYNIIKSHTQLTYTPGLWNAYYTTDKKSNGKLYSIYSDKPGSTPPYEYTIGANQCGSSTPGSEGGCYNREHLWPQSKFGGQTYPMYSDLWIAYPTDSKVNGQRADYPYGKVNTATWTSLNGSKLGANAYPGAPATTAFEPIDSFKGDIARSYFYITTRYYGDSAQFNDWEMATKSTLKPWAIQMLLAWHHLDPVSAKEKTRNDAAYALQNNRNPFIDNPAYADSIWAAAGGGTQPGVGVAGYTLADAGIILWPNPAISRMSIDWTALAPGEVLAVGVLNIQGQQVYRLQNAQGRAADIDIANWPKGLYLVQLHTLHGLKMEKVIVE